MKRHHASARDRWRYKFDNAVSAGTAPLIIWLGGVTALLILTAAVILTAIGVHVSAHSNFIEAVWQSLLRALDTGTMAGDSGWRFRVISLLVTLGGIFIVSTLIGVLATGIDRKLDELRKGRSLVLEEGHTLILGWSPKLMTILSELMIANQNQKDPVIVVMSSEDKVFMDDHIRSRLAENSRTRIVTRTGDISDPSDLAIVNPLESKAVIILNPGGEGSDAEIVRSVLALMQQDQRLEKLNVVAELTDESTARALGMATGGRVATVVSSDIIARITAQVCRQSGLSAVYQELLDFDGDEIYFSHEPKTVGMTFADALVSFETSSIIGIRFDDGRVELNPPMTTRIGERDAVVAISEDDDKIIFSGPMKVLTDGARSTGAEDRPAGERLLIVGWNFLGRRIVEQLDSYVPPGSVVHIMYDPEHVLSRDLEFGNLTNLHVTLATVDTSQREPLEELFEESSFDHVVVLCYRHGLTVAEADAQTLMTLLQLRHLVGGGGDSRPSIVTELLDVKDVELARVANPDDFVVSESLVSLLMTQLSENPELGSVFADLFDSYESEIVLRPAHLYVAPGESLVFGQAVAAARAFDEVAIGFRKTGDGSEAPSTIVVNPPKNEPLTFTERDELIVLTNS